MCWLNRDGCLLHFTNAKAIIISAVELDSVLIPFVIDCPLYGCVPALTAIPTCLFSFAVNFACFSPCGCQFQTTMG